MAFDLTATISLVRFLTNIQVGTITDNDVRDNYINPAMQDWFRRYERRPGSIQQGITTTASQSYDYISAEPDVSFLIERVARRVTPQEFVSMKRDEFNRLRFLQETEGAVNAPELWAAQYRYDTSIVTTPFIEFAWYPIPDAAYLVDIYGQLSLTSLSAGTDAAPTDPISARYIARLAAYRLGIDFRLSSSRLEAIIFPLPAWVRAHDNMQRLFDSKAADPEDVILFEPEPARA